MTLHLVRAALGAVAQDAVVGDALVDLGRHLLPVLLQRAVGLAQQVAGDGDHLFLGEVALGDEVHVLLQLGGHLRGGDARGELLEGLGHLDAHLGGLHRVAVHVAPVVEVLDDGVPRGLGAQVVLLHELDERAPGRSATGAGSPWPRAACPPAPPGRPSCSRGSSRSFCRL